MSDHLLVASCALALVVAALLGRAALPPALEPHIGELVARGELTIAQAALVQAGLSLEDARAIPDDCARRCTFTIQREFPLVCDCPGDQP